LFLEIYSALDGIPESERRRKEKRLPLDCFSSNSQMRGGANNTERERENESSILLERRWVV
jgi:hypothetical protein